MGNTPGFTDRLFQIVTSCVVGLAISLNVYAEIDRATLALLATSLVKVQVTTSQGGIGMGTGVVIARGKVITNCHVTKDAERIQLVQDGIQWNVTAAAPDMYHDLCLLIVSGLNLPPLKIGTASKLNVGDEVTAAGFAFGGKAHFSQGNVHALYAFDNGRVIRTNAPFAPGDSGGALVDRDGKLVGILSFFSGGANSFFAIPVDWFVERIGNMKAYQPIAPIADTPFWYRPTLAELPHFLQAANFEARAQWSNLLTLSENWLRLTPNHPEAWLARGNALQQIGDLAGATAAHIRAATLYSILDQTAAQQLMLHNSITAARE
ncbi:MAG: trypsin-like peptidase domain-containing protein [Pseudomonadota bacterium]|nr:trypsin-like peptidase domain-containing protein [Pseudomonadota bacterium]